nr:Gag-Pol polyprotein [Tanacetum cinerariifolium]
MINYIHNGDQPLPVIAPVSLARTAQNAPPTLKDPNNKTAKDLWDALERQMRGFEYAEQDRKAIIFYEYENFKATEGEKFLDTYLCYLQVINDLKKCGYKKDNCELNYKFLNNLQPEWKQYDTLMRQTKNLIDINIDALYNILKQNQGDVNDALGYKNKAIVVTSDPLALVAEKTKVSKRKEKVKVQSESKESDDEDISDLKKITSLLAKAFNQKKYYAKPTNNNLRTSLAFSFANKKSEYVKSVEKKENKKADEKKRDMSKVKCYNCKKEGHFVKDCMKAKVKDYNYYKTKMLLAKKDSDEQVLLPKDQAWIESSSNYDQEINANMVFMAQIKKVLLDSKESSSSAEEIIAEVIGLGYTPMFLIHSNEALEIEKFKRARENKIEFAYDYGNQNASYVNEKIKFSNDYFQEIINLDFKKIDSLFQQTSSLKPYVSTVILKKTIIDLEDEIVSLLEKEKANLKTIESLKSIRFESSDTAICELENHSENDCQVVEKECDKVENSKNVENLDAFSSVRRPKQSSVIWKKKGSSNTSMLVCLLLCDLSDENNLFIFDDESVRIYPFSKMPFRKKPRDSLNVRSKSNSNKSLPRTVHRWLPKMQPLAEPVAKWIPRIYLWIIDSGCSKHMMGNHAILKNFVEKFLETVRFGNNNFAVIAGYRDVVIGSMTINKDYYVEGLGHNLFSIGQFCDKGLEVAFRKSTCFVRNEDGVDFLTGDRSSNLYTIALNEVASNSLTCLLAKVSSSQSWLWHQRLLHLNFATINNLMKTNLVEGLPKMKFEKDHLCSACEQEKIHREHHKSKTAFASNKPLYLLHMDLCGPMLIKSINGKLYVLVVVDDFLWYTWHVRTDNGTEFKNKTLAKFFAKVGITQQFSAARTPQQNGVVERRNRTLVEVARTILTFANLALFLWAEAIATACFTQNHSIIHKRFDKTPYELMNKRKPNIKFFRVFRCRCYLLNDYEDVGKLKAKGDIRLFVGYSKESAAFRIYNKRTRKIHESVNVNFDEISQMASKQFSLEPGLSNLNETGKSSNLVIMKSSTTNVETSNVEIPLNEEEVFHERSESFQGESSSSSLNDHVHQSSEEVGVPSSNTQSILNNMISNVDEASTSHNVFNECLEDAYFDASIDYDEPFAPVARIEAIRLFLAYATHKDFTVFQMDVKTMFLNGILKEELYIGQPLVFVSKQYPDHVYALDKALYGLKQAPRAWYDVLSQFLIDSDFQKVGKPVDHTDYRSMIGSLMYVTSSRPNIMFATCMCERYQANPNEHHVSAVKSIFCYLKGTSNLGLWYLKDSGFDLTDYSDAAHAGCHLDQKSTPG